jgi:hypothetical protein
VIFNPERLIGGGINPSVTITTAGKLQLLFFGGWDDSRLLTGGLYLRRRKRI